MKYKEIVIRGILKGEDNIASKGYNKLKLKLGDKGGMVISNGTAEGDWIYLYPSQVRQLKKILNKEMLE